MDSTTTVKYPIILFDICTGRCNPTMFDGIFVNVNSCLISTILARILVHIFLDDMGVRESTS